MVKFKIPYLDDLKDDINLLAGYTQIQDSTLHKIIRHIRIIWLLQVVISILLTLILITLIVK